MGRQNWWLSDYLIKLGIEPNEFAASFERIENAGTDQIKTHLWLEEKDGEPEKLLKRIKVKPQQRTFEHIENALNQFRKDSRQSDFTQVDVRDFHQSWQAAMLDRWQPFSAYKSLLLAKINQLKESQYPLNLLDRP